MQSPAMVERRDFENAVNGWRQSVGIMAKLRDSLAFTVAEMEAEVKRSPGAFGTSPEKAAKFYDAQCALRTADAYLSAMDQTS
jgi:hypothetical protein